MRRGASTMNRGGWDEDHIRTAPRQLRGPARSNPLSNLRDRFNGIHMPDWSNRKKIGAGILLFALWQGATADNSPVPNKYLPSPGETAVGLLNGTEWVIQKIDNGIDSIGSKDESSSEVPVVTVPTPTASSAPEATTASTPAATGSTLAPLPTTATTAPSTVGSVETVAPTTVAPVGEALPSPMQYSAAAGSVVCRGNIVSVTITPDGGAPFSQMRNATGEPWDAGVAPHSDDNQLFAEVLVSNGYPQEPDGAYTLLVRNGCTGLEQ